jgi:hypothetical protein
VQAPVHLGPSQWRRSEDGGIEWGPVRLRAGEYLARIRPLGVHRCFTVSRDAAPVELLVEDPYTVHVLCVDRASAATVPLESFRYRTGDAVGEGIRPAGEVLPRPGDDFLVEAHGATLFYGARAVGYLPCEGEHRCEEAFSTLVIELEPASTFVFEGLEDVTELQDPDAVEAFLAALKIVGADGCEVEHVFFDLEVIDVDGRPRLGRARLWTPQVAGTSCSIRYTLGDVERRIDVAPSSRAAVVVSLAE